MKQNVLQTIRAEMDHLSKGHKRIAQYILDNYDKAAFMTAARLAETADVSESTVVRFAAHLGYEGYPEMQRALQEIVRGKLTSIQRIQVSRQQINDSDILGSVMQRDADSIRSAINGIDREDFDRVVDKLQKAEHIYILGVRSSSFLAGYLNFYFHLIFKNVIYVQNTAAGEIYEQLVHIGPGDVLIGITFPRYSKMVIHAVEMASERGADVIAITDSKVSPLYPLSSAALLVGCDAISFVDSMAAPLSLLNALIVAVGRQRSDDVSHTFAEMEKVWTKYNIFGKAEDD
ncbi:MAG: MurR/RpiR family transcriptional regulator [Oscillospiraceae bacterium]|nr:MurR/RpiR family transcriptional regulator [Oscillospiraceae bacterium]